MQVPGSQELLIIALVALFVLGPERLPEVARAASRLLTRVRNYGVTASKELHSVTDLADLGDIEREVSDLRRELERTRSDLRRAMRETVASSRSALPPADVPSETGSPEPSDTSPDAPAATRSDGAPDLPDERA